MTHFLQFKGLAACRLPSHRGLLFFVFMLFFSSQEAWASSPALESEGADDGAEATAGASPPPPTDHFAHFSELFEASCPHIPPFPLNFIREGVVFDKEKDGNVKVFDEETKELLEEFTVPEDLDAEGLRPYFVALKMAAVAKNPKALTALARFRALLKNLGRGDVLQKLESTPLPPEALVENFPAWVTSLRTSLVDPFDTEPVAFIRDHTDNLEWMETVFRGWFVLADGAEVTGAQAATLIGSALSLGEFLSAFTVKLFALFEDDKMGPWEKDFFQSAAEAAGDDTEVAAGLDFTPEEQRTHVRRRMFAIHQMIMQAYLTVEDMLGSLTIQGMSEAEDLKVKEDLYDIRKIFTSGGTLHSNRLLVAAREGDIDFMATYLDFMATLLERSSRAATHIVGHPLYKFLPELSDAENEKRLEHKIQRLNDMLIPTVEAAVAYFALEGKNYLDIIARLPVPDDITEESVAALHRAQALAKTLPIEYKAKYHGWSLNLNGGALRNAEGDVYQKVGYRERLGQLKAQRAGLREALGMPKL